jgi:hypothetical protein
MFFIWQQPTVQRPSIRTRRENRNKKAVILFEKLSHDAGMVGGGGQLYPT